MAAKEAAFAALLGPPHNTVSHALIPFGVGGSLDLYYYPHHLPGTFIVTKELLYDEGPRPKNDLWEGYELVMATREGIALDHARDADHPFGIMHRLINAVLNLTARYAGEATLNPGETMEFPADFGEDLGGRCLILDAYRPGGRDLVIAGQSYGLMLIMQVHRAEMEWSQEHSGEELLARLQAAGAYPYSDPDRGAVV